MYLRETDAGGFVRDDRVHHLPPPEAALMDEATRVYRDAVADGKAAQGLRTGRRYQFRPMTDEAWAGRARMADARRAAGIELDDVDREAVARRG
jgi:hypothetical protein